MKINTRKLLEDWLNKNHWFEDGFVSEINYSKNGIEIVIGYQTHGTYLAGEEQELKQYLLKFVGVKKWTYKKDLFLPTIDSCINGIELTSHGVGLIFETPSLFELICESIEISEPKIIKNFTKPWINDNEISISVIKKEIPTVKYWIDQFREFNIEIGFRYYSGEIIQPEKVPYPDYSGYFIQTLNEINNTKEGLFFSFIKMENEK